MLSRRLAASVVVLSMLCASLVVGYPVTGVAVESAQHWSSAEGPLQPGVPVSSYIETEGDVDWYHFYTSGLGQVLVGANSAVATRFTLFRPDGGNLVEEGRIVTSGLIDKQLPAGLYYVKVAGHWADSFSATEPYDLTVSGTATLPSSVNVIPVAGTSRYETAVEASKLAFPEGADTVVIATGRNWPDALGGSALAGALDAPILLVNTNSVPDVVSAEIARLNATKAVIIGGSAAVGAPVEAALQNAGLSIERVWGTDRYLTADAVARRVIELLGDTYDGTAFVATGGAYADAVAAGPLAARKGWPLYLAHPTGGLRAPTLAAMAGVTDTLVLGGPAAVSQAAEATLNSRLGAGHVTRLAGESRYGTAAAVAEHGVANAGLSFDRVGIATGQAYPDALAGGVLQGKVGSVMLLTRTASLPDETAQALADNKAAISTVTYFGGELAVSSAVRTDVGQVLQ